MMMETASDYSALLSKRVTSISCLFSITVSCASCHTIAVPVTLLNFPIFLSKRGMFGSIISTSFPGSVILPGNEVALTSIYYLCYRNTKNMHLTNLKQLQVNIGSVFSISLVIRFSTWIQYAQMTMDGLHDFSFVSRVIQLFVERVLRAVYRTRDIEWEWCLVSSLTCNFAVQLVISRQSLS